MAISLNQGNIPPLPGVLVSRPGDRMLGSTAAQPTAAGSMTASAASSTVHTVKDALLAARDAIQAALSVEVSRYRSVELTVAENKVNEALALAEKESARV